MYPRRLVLACLAVMGALVGSADRASGALSSIFGLTSFVISPPSGTATAHDVLTIQMSGVAGSALIPRGAFVSAPTPDTRLIALTNPDSVGISIPTPWSRQITLGPLAAGSYDFSVSERTGSPPLVVGPELAIADFVVVPEPTGALLACAGAMALVVARSMPTRTLRRTQGRLWAWHAGEGCQF